MDKSKASGTTALNVLSAPLFSFNRRIVIEQSAPLRLPAIYEWPEMAEEGGLIGYGPRLTLIYRQLTRLIVKVLGGVEPKDLPVDQPTKFDLVVNLETAKAARAGHPRIVPRPRRRGGRITMPVAALHESGSGTNLKCRRSRYISAIRSKAEDCSQRVSRLLTQLGRWLRRNSPR